MVEAQLLSKVRTAGRGARVFQMACLEHCSAGFVYCGAMHMDCNRICV